MCSSVRRFIFTNFTPDRKPKQVEQPQDYFYLPSRTANFAKDNDSEEFHESEDHAARFHRAKLLKLATIQNSSLPRLPVGISRAYSPQRDSFRPLVCRFPLSRLCRDLWRFTRIYVRPRGHGVSPWPVGGVRTRNQANRRDVPAGSTGDPSS